MTAMRGSYINRAFEGQQSVEEITVGTGVTEFGYSDRHAYEVVAVKDQKHITIRQLDHKLIGEAYSNEWELIPNEENPSVELVKRGAKWYSEQILDLDTLAEARRRMSEDGDPMMMLWICGNEFNVEKLEADGKPQKRYHHWNISIGHAEYYYDYEF